MKLIGHAAVFNSQSLDLGGFREVIAPGAFSRTLRDGHPVFFVHHHQMADLLGSTRSGSLKLREDSKGLHFELELPDSNRGRDLHELVRRDDLTSMSFSFKVNGTNGERWAETSRGGILRTLTDVSLTEISTVALPAYPASTVSARAAQAANDSIPNRNQATRNRMLRRYMTATLKAA